MFMWVLVNGPIITALKTLLRNLGFHPSLRVVTSILIDIGTKSIIHE